MIRLSDFRRTLVAAALVATTGALQAADAPAAGAAASAPAARNEGPAPECTAALDKLAADVPVRESGPTLRSMGLWIRTPILVPESLLTERDVVSGARIRVMIDKTGRVVPGSVTVQQSLGDPKLPLVLSQAVPTTLSFDVSRAFTVPEQFPFTTVYVVCASSS